VEWFDLVTSRHPRLLANVAQPIRDGWDKTAAVFFNMLFADIAHWHFATGRVFDHMTEHSFGLKNSLGVMTKRAMSEISECLFCGIKPIMDSEIILRFAAEDSGGIFRVVIRVAHRELS